MTQNPESCTILYKILNPTDYKAAFEPAPIAGDYWLGIPLDVNDGFLHTSTSAQLEATLNRYYADDTVVHILTVPRSHPRIEATLKFDLAESIGEMFGHLYEGLDLVKEVEEDFILRKDASAKWDLSDRKLVF